MPITSGGPVMKEIELPALQAGSPLGFLAAIGMLRLLVEERGHAEAAIYWPSGGRFSPGVRLLGPWTGVDHLVTELAAVIEAIPGSGVLPGCDPKFPAERTGNGAGGDPTRAAMPFTWEDTFAVLGDTENRWRRAIVIPRARAFVLHLMHSASGNVDIARASGEHARRLGLAGLYTEELIDTAIAGLHERGLITPSPDGGAGRWQWPNQRMAGSTAVAAGMRSTLTYYMAPIGRQTARSFFAKPLQAVRSSTEQLLMEALGDWRWHDGHTGEMLDGHSYTGPADATDGLAGWRAVPGAVWLATMALPLDPLRLSPDDGVESGLWHWDPGRATMVMTIPAWDEPLTLPQVEALIHAGGDHPSAWGHYTASRYAPPPLRGRGLLYPDTPSFPSIRDQPAAAPRPAPLLPAEKVMRLAAELAAADFGHALVLHEDQTVGVQHRDTYQGDINTDVIMTRTDLGAVTGQTRQQIARRATLIMRRHGWGHLLSTTP
jgi:hypothetical protein